MSSDETMYFYYMSKFYENFTNSLRSSFYQTFFKKDLLKVIYMQIKFNKDFFFYYKKK